MNNAQKIYKKVVVAKHNPQNGCYATDGDVLFIKPRLNVPQKTVVQHHFTSSLDKKSKSKYGWIKEVPDFTLDDFVYHHMAQQILNSVEIEHILTMLESVESLAVDTPVTCDYKSRGAIKQSMQVTVHKVFFYAA